MQGSFPVGADWDSALDPQNDDDVQRQVRSDHAERELWNLARNRNPAAPPPFPARLNYVEGPFPPSAFFQLHDGTRFYILKDHWKEEHARQGRLGHYLVTTVAQRFATGAPPGHILLNKPFLHQTPLPTPIFPPNDAPGMNSLDIRHAPSSLHCMPGRDYTTPSMSSYCEIGLQALKASLEAAEALDLAFARRMEGLGNLGPQVCWDCLDPDYDPHDRPGVRDQFLAKYLAGFYDKVEPDDGPRVENVAEEAVHKHKAFCQAWVKKHYKTLTPAVTAPAEALASEFYKHIEASFHPSGRLSRAELARVLMRHPETSAEFATCLHFYSTGLEQTRGGRNASYKQMSMTTHARTSSYRRMGDLLGDKMPELTRFFQSLENLHERHFHPFTTDWHYILGQMPQIHRHFDANDSFRRQASRRPNPNAAGHVPPWRFGR